MVWELQYAQGKSPTLGENLPWLSSLLLYFALCSSNASRVLRTFLVKKQTLKSQVEVQLCQRLSRRSFRVPKQDHELINRRHLPWISELKICISFQPCCSQINPGKAIGLINPCGFSCHLTYRSLLFSWISFIGKGAGAIGRQLCFSRTEADTQANGPKNKNIKMTMGKGNIINVGYTIQILRRIGIPIGSLPE